MVIFVSSHQSFIGLDKASPWGRSGLISLSFRIDVYFRLACRHVVVDISHVATTFINSALESQEVVSLSFILLSHDGSPVPTSLEKKKTEVAED